MQGRLLKWQRKQGEQATRRLSTQLDWLLEKRSRQLVAQRLMLRGRQRVRQRLLVHRRMLQLRSLVRQLVLRLLIMEGMHMTRARQRRRHVRQLEDRRKLKRKLQSMLSMMLLRLCFMMLRMLLMRKLMRRRLLGRANTRSGSLLLRLLRKLSWQLVGVLRRQLMQHMRLRWLLVTHLRKLLRRLEKQQGMLCFMRGALLPMLRRQLVLHARPREDLQKLKGMLLVRQ